MRTSKTLRPPIGWPSASLFVFSLLGALGVLAVEPLLSADPAVLTKSDLSREPIQFLGFGDGRLRYFGQDRNLTSLDIRQAVRVRWERGGQAAAGPELRLADGQVLRGWFVGVTERGQVKWEDPTLGAMEFALDDVASFHAITRRAGEAAAQKGGQRLALPVSKEKSDAVLLANGDQLEGFIDSISPKSVKLKRDNQDVELPWDSIASVVLTNPVREKAGVWVTPAAGGRVRVERPAVAGGRVTGQVLSKPLDIPLDAVRTIDFAQTQRLAPLGELPHRVTSGGTVFGVEYPPVLGTDRVSLHAPLTLKIDLPLNARRFAATALLSREDLQWADMVLIVSDGKGELYRKQLSDRTPQDTVNVVPRDRTLTIRLDEGAKGPIRDRLQLLEPYVLVDIPTEKRGR